MSFGVAFLLSTSASSSPSSSPILAAPDPTADALVAKSFPARGGVTGLAAINTLDFGGKLIAPGGFQPTYHGTRARNPNGGRMREDLTIQGLTIQKAYDGQSAWKVEPFLGRKGCRAKVDRGSVPARQASVGLP